MKIILNILIILMTITCIKAQTIYTVTNTNDPDPFLYFENPNNPAIVGSLQWAVRKVNEQTTACIINFDIPGNEEHVILLNSDLPIITNQVMIDGYSQQAYQYGNPQIIIDGQEIVGGGLYFYNSNNSIIKGICVRNCLYNNLAAQNCNNITILDNLINQAKRANSISSATGLRLISSVNNIIKGNFIGTDFSGANKGNADYGIFIDYGCSMSEIGGTGFNEGNTIAYNGLRGLWIGYGSGHKISGNIIFNNPVGILLQAGVNNDKQAPVILSYSENGTVTGTSQPNDIIEIFGSTGNENANEYLTSTTTDASGNWTATVTNNSWAYVVSTAMDENGNSSKLCNAFFIYNPLTVNYNIIGSIDDSICSISLTVNGGQPPYEYSWNTGDNTDALTDVPIGDYTATVTDSTGETQQTEITVQEITTVLRTVGLTQMKLLPVPQHSYINFITPNTPQISNLPINYNAPVNSPIHDENILFNYREEMDAFYLGQHPKFAQTMVSDKNGNLLFFIIDNNIYNKFGSSFVNANNISGYEHVHDNYSNICNLSGVESYQYINRFLNEKTMGSEIVVLPLPNTCNEFIVIYYIVAEGTYPSYASEVFYRKITYIDDTHIEMTNPVAFSCNMDAGDALACNDNIRISLAASDYRADFDNYLLFIRYQSHLYVYEVNYEGINTSNVIKNDFDMINTATSSGQIYNKSEMELMLKNNYYYLALPYNRTKPSYIIYKLNYDGTQAYNVTTPLIWDLSINQNTASPRGLEFSPDGNYLYFSFTGQDALYYLNLDFVYNNTFPSIFNIQQLDILGNTPGFLDNPINYQFSQIELGRDGRLYYVNHLTKTLSYLENPNNPSSPIWKKYGDSGYLYSSLTSLYPSHDNDASQLIYVFPDQVDGSNYETNYPLFNPIIDNWPNASEYFSSVTWSPSNNPWGNKSEVFLYANNIIPAGKSITIKNMKLYFVNEAYLELSNGAATNQKGAKLVFENTTLSTYNTCINNSGMWKGIELKGIPNHTQYSLNTVQPTIELKNSNFYNSIYGINTEEGGIVKISNSTFKNNANAINIITFQNPGNKASENASYISNSSFITDKDLNNSNYYFGSHLLMMGVYGINITSCTFKDIRNNSAPYRCNGIYSFDATYNLKSSCSVPVQIGGTCPTDQIKSNYFIGLDYGIKASAINPTNSLTVEKTNFIGNSKSISLTGINGAKVTKCSFTSDASYSGDISYYGMYLTGCSGYTIQENTFTGGTSGINISGSGTTYNKLYNNTFTDLINDESNSTSIVTEGANGVSGGTGLEIKCNDFTSNHYNIYIYDGIIKQSQGQNTTDDPTKPAGNTFTELSNLQSNFLDDGGGAGYNYYKYYYHALSPITDLGTSSQYDDYHVEKKDVYLQFIKPISCPSQLNSTTTVTEATTTIRSMNTIINNEINQFKQLVDGGSTQLLLQKVETVKPGNYKNVCDQLLDASPYLSDTVLLTFMRNDFRGQPNKRRDVLIANSPMPQKAKEELVNTWLPKPFMQQVESLQNGTNAREQKEQQIVTLQSNKQDLLNSVVSSSLQNDSVPQVLDSLVTLLQEQPEHETKFTLVPLLNRMKRYSDAQSELSDLQNQIINYPSDYISEITDYVQLQELLIELADTTTNDSIWVRNNESFLTQLAESGNIGFANAQALLEYYGIAQYEEIVHLPNPADLNKSMRLPNQTNQFIESAVQTDGIFIYPNPVKDNLIIELNGSYENETITLYNTIGDKVFEHTVNDNNTIKISTANLPQGIYLLKFTQCGFTKKITRVR